MKVVTTTYTERALSGKVELELISHSTGSWVLNIAEDTSDENIQIRTASGASAEEALKSLRAAIDKILQEIVNG